MSGICAVSSETGVPLSPQASGLGRISGEREARMMMFGFRARTGVTRNWRSHLWIPRSQFRSTQCSVGYRGQ